MSRQGITPVGDLSAQPIAGGSGSPVEVAGRLVCVWPRGFRLADAAGDIECLWPETVTFPMQGMAPGDWLCAQGEWDGTYLRLQGLRRLQASGSGVLDGWWRLREVQTWRRRLAERQRLLGLLRQTLQAWGFLEVETPLLAAAPAWDAHIDSMALAGARQAWLITSPELPLKQLLVQGFTRVYQLGKVFRANECGDVHAPEFTMLEWYRTFANVEALMADTEALLVALVQAVTGQTQQLAWRGQIIDVQRPWLRLTVDEALQQHAGLGVAQVLPDEDAFFRLWAERVQPALGAQRATFVTDWPAALAANAQLCRHDPGVAERFEAYIAGVELCNGYGELTDAGEQERRWAAERHRRGDGAKDLPIDQSFLASMRLGLPPCSGNALGVDRLLMLLMGAARIDEVMASGLCPHPSVR